MGSVFAVDIGSLSPTFGTFKTFGDVVSVVVKNAFVLAGIIAFVLLVVGALGVIAGAGSGEAKQLEQSKQTITLAVVGLLIIIGSFSIIQIISAITGINLLSPK